jgi:serine phosphatase RsbU (regulator of sigma subunit)
MSAEPSLTVAGPVPGRIEAGSDRDVAGTVPAVPVLHLMWDAGGACTGATAGTRAGDGATPGAPAGDGPAALAGDGWLAALHPDDAGRAAALLAAVLADGAPRDDGVRSAGGDRWAVLRIEATPGGAAGVLVDATRSLRDSNRMARIVGGLNRHGAPDAIVQAVLDVGMATLHGGTAAIYVLSDAGDALEVAGMAGMPEEAVRSRFGSIPLDAPLPVAEVMRTGQMITVTSPAERRARYPLLDELDIVLEPAFVVVPLVDAEDRPFGAFAVGFPDERTLREPERDFLRDVAAQCALALDRARLTVIAERRQERLTFLDRLSESLSSDLDLESTLTRLAETAVPRLADWCVVRLASAPGDPGPFVGAAHVDPGRSGDLVRLAQRLPRSLDLLGELGPALESGHTVVRHAAAGDLLVPLLGSEAAHALDAVGMGAVVVHPLRARGRLLGGVAFGNRPERPLRPDDLELAELVATRAATLVDNARLFREQSGVARALQHSLLPGSLPAIPGLELGARYRAAGLGLDVGGDFYDAFRADANWWIVAVGDVCGHGVEAAAITGLVRHTIRASVGAGAMPSAILGRLNDMLLRHLAEMTDDVDDLPLSPRFCTVALGVVQPTPRGVDLVLCLGGHPPPLVRRADGEVVPVGVPGTLLGVTRRVGLVDSVVHLDAGDVLACFTDGITDRRTGRDTFGDEGVAAALRSGHGLSAPDLAAHIEAAAVGFTPDEPIDDMAVITLAPVPGA